MRYIGFIAFLVIAVSARADGPADNKVESVRPIPPKGSPVPAADRAALTAELKVLGEEIDALKKSLQAPQADLLPDVEICHKAVRYALDYDEIYIDKGRDDVKSCTAVLKLGRERAAQLKDGKHPWTTATGLVVRAYRSRIDGSVQPYGLVIPKEYTAEATEKRRLDVWWAGRGETRTEVNFLQDRQKNAGEFTPAGAIVLHPYGRFCNANKFAGEVDTFEALDHVKKYYRIDDRKLVARGFSMGGAACWQFATHFPTTWAAANPGAGFAETPEFLNNFQNEVVKPTWYEEKLFRMYNATDYALNIFNVPTVAYSGEIDKQKQAADVMTREMKKVGLELTHVIGPKTAHKYEPGAKKEVAEKLDAILAKEREAMPKEIRFVTYSLRYNKCAWLEVTGLEKHWERSEIAGTYQLLDTPDTKFKIAKVSLTTSGVTGFNVTVSDSTTFITVNGKRIANVNDELKSRHISLVNDVWEDTSMRYLKDDARKPKQSAKIPGLQGPIDDAFHSRFLMVTPTGKPYHDKAGDWVAIEMKHATEHWRKQYRGNAPIMPDSAVTEAEIADSNLILWGDPSSNVMINLILPDLPLRWTADTIEFNGTKYDTKRHIPVMIFPNPRNPKRYVVLNSGFTYREYDYLNNARQVPKLPDYAILDVTAPPTPRAAGKVVAAGFFDEKWKLQSNDGRTEAFRVNKP